MLALAVVLVVIVALLGVVVTGLLRSHADIIRALHELGVGVGDPSGAGQGHPPAAPPDIPVHLRSGPPLPAERSASSVHDLTGLTPAGDPVAVAMDAAELTLLAFLSSSCASCVAFWEALGDPTQRAALPSGTRVVVVTKGPEWESPPAVAGRAPRGVTVVMSSDAWSDYEVPGSPYFALVDGPAGVRIGEGVANRLDQVADMIGRAELDERNPANASRSRAAALGLDGAEREADNDAALLAAGITPGHPSLYPRTLEDVFRSTAPPGAGEVRPGSPR